MTNKPILLITGGSGYLGQHLVRQASQLYDCYATYRTNASSIQAGQPIALDLTNPDEVSHCIQTLKPHGIIHAAAINPGQGDGTLMQQVNVEGSRAVATAAATIKARLVHVSSDVVHDGRDAPYSDEAAPSPINVYGQSKADGEAAVKAVNPQAAIARTSLIYGFEVMDRGTEGFVNRLQSGQPLQLFNDVIRQPVWVESLATALLKLVEFPFAGTLNVSGRQAMTREAFGRKMLNWWGVGYEAQIGSTRAADLSDTIALDLRVSVDKAEKLLQMELFGVDEMIERIGSGKKIGSLGSHGVDDDEDKP